MENAVEWFSDDVRLTFTWSISIFRGFPAASNGDGQVDMQAPPGAYYVEPQPVQGLLGTAQAFAFSVVAGETVDFFVPYDTGIR